MQQFAKDYTKFITVAQTKLSASKTCWKLLMIFSPLLHSVVTSNQMQVTSKNRTFFSFYVYVFVYVHHKFYYMIFWNIPAVFPYLNLPSVNRHKKSDFWLVIREHVYMHCKNPVTIRTSLCFKWNVCLKHLNLPSNTTGANNFWTFLKSTLNS